MTDSIPNPKPKRCQHDGCKKKIPITAHSCRCSLYHCQLHRLPTTHNCTFDYKNSANMKQNNEKLIEKMKCVSHKIETI